MSNEPTVPEPKKSDRDNPPASRRLTRTERGAAAAAAIVAGGGGIYGVFEEGTNTGGVPVLIAAAAFFGYLAISGQRLSSLRIGDSEAKFDRIAERVTRDVLEDPAVPADVKSDVAEALDAYRGDLPPRSRRAIDTAIESARAEAAYRVRALGHLGQVVRDRRPADSLEAWNSFAGHALLLSEGEQPPILVVAGRAIGSQLAIGPLFGNVVNEARVIFPQHPHIDRILVITDELPTSYHGETIKLGQIAVLTRWRDEQDDDAVLAGLDRLLAATP